MQNSIINNSPEMIFVDSHCHLMFEKFVGNGDIIDEKYKIDAIIKRANDAGVKYILAVGTKLEDIEEIIAITEKSKNVFRTVGVHPLDTQQHLKKYSLSDIQKIIINNCEAATSNNNSSSLVGIGEIGLDYYYSKDNIYDQRKLFETQLEVATKYKLPVCVHSRDAENDTIAILKNHPEITGVIHCFTGSKKFAFDALDLGFYISVSGVITFKKSNELCEVVRSFPLNKTLVETDAPFLAPTPFRGKTNEPAFVIHIAEKLAEILRVPLSEVAQKTTSNFLDLYQLKN